MPRASYDVTVMTQKPNVTIRKTRSSNIFTGTLGLDYAIIDQKCAAIQDSHSKSSQPEMLEHLLYFC